VLLAAPGLAWGDGGATIAAAPVIQFGQQEFGNTADAQPSGGFNCDLNTWWLLPATAGDRVTIDYEEQSRAIEWVRLYPIGTTDFNVHTAQPVAEQLWPPDQNELQFSAGQTGNMPLLFQGDVHNCVDGGQPGPYDFTAYVAHALRLAVPAIGTLPLRGIVSVGVHSPDGALISDPSLSVALQVEIGKQWTTVGSAAPDTGTAAISYTMPLSTASHRTSLRAVASGAGYITQTSSARKLSLPPVPPVKILSRSTRVARRHAPVAVSCPAAAPHCAGTLTLTLGSSGLGRERFSIAGGQRQTVPVALSKTALRALSAAPHHRLSVLARAGRAHGTITLRG
jgi:hypothetical protein